MAAVEELTFTAIEQLLGPAARVPPVKPTDPAPAVPPDVVPLQLLVSPGELATTRLVGKLSVTANPVSAELPEGLLIVIVRRELTPVPTVVGANVFVTVVAALTVNVAAAVPPVPPFVEVTAFVVFVEVAVSVTVAVTVQLAPAAMEPPVRTIDVEVEVAADPLGQFVVAPVCVMPEGKLSVTPTPVSVVLAFGLVMRRVSVEVPPDAMVVGANVLVIVGGAVASVRTAVASANGEPPVQLQDAAVLV